MKTVIRPETEMKDSSIEWIGYNPMVGATVAVAVSVEEAAKAGRF